MNVLVSEVAAEISSSTGIILDNSNIVTKYCETCQFCRCYLTDINQDEYFCITSYLHLICKQCWEIKSVCNKCNCLLCPLCGHTCKNCQKCTTLCRSVCEMGNRHCETVQPCDCQKLYDEQYHIEFNE